jgi:hypothetical protein
VSETKEAKPPFDPELIEQLRAKAFMARGYRETLFVEAANGLERLWAQVHEYWGLYNDALERWNAEITLRQQAEAKVEKLQSALLGVALRIDSSGPCFCRLHARLGAEHAGFCLAARAILKSSSKEGSGENPS